MIWTDLHVKPTDSHNYSHHESSHSSHCKKGLPYGKFLRVRQICSKMEDFQRHCLELKYHFLHRNYKCADLDEAYHRAKETPLDIARKVRFDDTEDDENVFLVTTFHPADSTLWDIVETNWEVLEEATVIGLRNAQFLDIDAQKTLGTCWFQQGFTIIHGTLRTPLQRENHAVRPSTTASLGIVNTVKPL